MFNEIKKSLPNGITCCNLVSGCIAVAFALEGNPRLAFLFIITGAVFDFFDGFTARALKVSSPIGKELDSLADDITFGLAPSAIAFTMLKQCAVPQSLAGAQEIYPYAAFVMAAFSALRLAKFNLDERQATSFIGLPTPANAIFWGASACSLNTELLASPAAAYIIIALAFISSALLVSEIPMFALKFKNFSWKDNKVKYIFLAVSLILIIAFHIGGLAIAILWYLMLSLITEKR